MDVTSPLPLTNTRVLLRTLAVALFGVGLALAAARVVARPVEPALFVPVAVAALTGWLAMRLHALLRLLAHVIAFCSSALAVALLTHGTAGDAIHGLLDGPRQILTTSWPSPRWPTVLVALAAVIELSVAAGTELAVRPRWRALAGAPCSVGLVVLLAAGAPDGPHVAPALMGAAAMFVLLWIGLDDRVPSIRWATPIAVGAALVASLASVGIVWSQRADPRRPESATSQISLLDPLADVVAQRETEPARALFEVSGSSLSQLAHWRVAALDSYDGESWSVPGDVTPAGNQLSAGTGAPTTAVQITALTTETELWPVPGNALAVTAPVDTDATHRVIRIVGSRPAAETFTIEPMQPFDPASLGSVGRVSPTDLEASFAPFARARAGEGSSTVVQQVAALATTMLTGYRFDATSPGGMQQKSLDYFLKDSRIGNREQFVAAFVLLARSLGIDARIATGYELAPSGLTATITTADASSWAEVRVDGRWVVVEVVPPEQGGGETPAPGTVGTRTPPAVQPAQPTDVQPDPVSNPVDDAGAAGSTDRWAVITRWASRIGLGGGALVVVLLLFATFVRGRKALRRRGLRAADPVRRVTTAWTLATDALVDAGATLHASQTNAELVAAGAVARPAVEQPLDGLRRHADATSYTTLPVPVAHADDAVRLLTEIESGLTADASLRWRLRWRLSTRSLRKRTQSPLRSSRF